MKEGGSATPVGEPSRGEATVPTEQSSPELPPDLFQQFEGSLADLLIEERDRERYPERYRED